MKDKSILQKNTIPDLPEQAREELTDQILLGGLPFRHNRRLQKVCLGKDWFASLIWLRVPLLLLGIVGALGLLAQYNARFAQTFRMIHWPDKTLSYVFLGIAGCVFALLLAEWIYVQAIRCAWALQRKRISGHENWRSR